MERVVVDDGFLPTFGVTMRSDDIRNQSRKLSNIARNFERFFDSQMLRGGPSENCTRVITPTLRHVDWKKFYEDTPVVREWIHGVIGQSTVLFLALAPSSITTGFPSLRCVIIQVSTAYDPDNSPVSIMS